VSNSAQTGTAMRRWITAVGGELMFPFLRGSFALLGLALLTSGSRAEVDNWVRLDAAKPMSFFNTNIAEQIDLRLWSKNRPGVKWSFVINAGIWGRTNINISCKEGETICYGAWTSASTSDLFWGVGKDGDKSCKNCCTVCDGREAQFQFHK